MKKICILLLSTAPLLSFAQYYKGVQASEFVQAAEEVKMNPFRETPEFIKLKKDAQPDVQVFESWMQEQIGLSTSRFQLQNVSKADALGYTHHRFQQNIGAVPIEWATVIAHTYAGKIQSVNGKLYRDIDIQNNVSLTKEDAFAKAIQVIGAASYKWERKAEEALLKEKLNKPGFSYDPTIELVLLPVDESSSVLNYAYKIDMYAHEPDGRWDVYVDASAGVILLKIERMCTIDVKGTAHTKYHGVLDIMTDSISTNVFRLKETNRSGRGMQIETLDCNKGDESDAVDFVDDDNVWNNVNANFDEAATDCHIGAGLTYDYFYDSLGRDSYDDQGSKLLQFVHYDNGWFNAQWTGSYSRYGDGINAPLTSIDIVSHEISHGITQETAGLIYRSESGALNESFSDIFGTVVEFNQLPNSASWIIGTRNFSLRNMASPNDFQNPDTYGGAFWTDTKNCIPSNVNDWCGVHNNSGVQNFWFYLLANGGSGTNDLGNVYSVDSLGMSVAAKITYRSLSVYLTQTSDYADARFYSIQAAIDLYGEDSKQHQAVANAWYAVGVGKPYSFIPIADFYVEELKCTPNSVVRFINVSGSANSYHWDFGDGATSIAESPLHQYTQVGSYDVTLIATNNNGSDTMHILNAVNIFTDKPLVSTCNTTTAAPYGTTGIYRVQFADLDNPSESPGNENPYMDFNCYRALVGAGETYPITVTTYHATPVFTRVWIDYNNDGNFIFPDELAFSSDNTIQTHTGDITIPLTAVTNVPLRMRVTSARPINNTPDNPCGLIRSGQVEDYSVVISPAASVQQISTLQAKVYPNPTQGNLYIESDEDYLQLKITNLLGSIIYEESFSRTTEIDTRLFSKGIYIVYINSDRKQHIQKISVE